MTAQHSAGHSTDGSDIFLHVQTRRAGKIKGECTVKGHEDDIVVRSWHWSISASSAIGSTAATGRRSYSGLEVRKGIDSSSTGLMSALVTNDEVKEAKLTIRRAGGEQEPYLIITLGGARVSALEHEVSTAGDAMEVVTILFTKVDVEYRGQKRSGGRGGSTTFSDEIFNQE